MATCCIHEQDEDIECFRESWDQDPVGLCILHSREVDKDKGKDFTEAVRTKLKSEDYDFRWVCFPDSFHLVNLTRQHKFAFAKPADFSKATFQKGANFIGATFRMAADFSRVTFQGIAAFYWTTFQGLTTFNTLALDWLLRNLPVPWRTWFRGRPAVFDEILLRKSLKEYVIRLWSLKLKYGRRVAYRLIDDKEDEPQKVGQNDYARVEELYQGLKLTYGEAGDFKRVGDFHFGEMEMHRLASPWRRVISWYSLYWALNGYGERPVRALFVLVGLILALPAVVFSLGTDNYLNTLLFILEKAALQRPEWPKTITWGGKLWSTLSALFIPGQTALFLLALRNRLGRRK